MLVKLGLEQAAGAAGSATAHQTEEKHPAAEADFTYKAPPFTQVGGEAAMWRMTTARVSTPIVIPTTSAP